MKISIVHGIVLLSLAFTLNATPRRTKAQNIRNKQLINAAAKLFHSKAENQLMDVKKIFSHYLHQYILLTMCHNWNPQPPLPHLVQ